MQTTTKKNKTNKLWHISTPGPVIEKKIANFQIYIYIYIYNSFIHLFISIFSFSRKQRKTLSTGPFFLGVPNFTQM
jgi:hypothetical protein